MIFLLYTPLVLLGAIAAALVYQFLGSRWDRRRFPAPGVLTPDGIHVWSRGEGGPAVILESGIAASSVSWARVAPELAQMTRVVAYDRPGLGWSAAFKHVLSPERFIQDLAATLHSAGVEGPYILVGHSFGGLVARLFAAWHPERVAGLVLVDPALVAEWAHPTPQRRIMLDRGIRFSRRGAVLARFGLVRLGLALAAVGAHGAAKFIARSSSSPGGQKTVERLIGEIRKMPAELWPVIRAHWCQPKAFVSMAEHLAVLPEMCEAAGRACVPHDLPLAVISGGHLSPEQRAEHEALAGLSMRGRHIIAEGSGHWVHLDRPELIVQAVREMVLAARSAPTHG